MMNLFIQVPVVVRKRLAHRCKDLYENAWEEQAARDGVDEGEAAQVRLCAVCSAVGWKWGWGSGPASGGSLRRGVEFGVGRHGVVVRLVQ